jgi:hypothetical protein
MFILQPLVIIGTPVYCLMSFPATRLIGAVGPAGKALIHEDIGLPANIKVCGIFTAKKRRH